MPIAKLKGNLLITVNSAVAKYFGLLHKKFVRSFFFSSKLQQTEQSPPCAMNVNCLGEPVPIVINWINTGICTGSLHFQRWPTNLL